MSYISLYEKYKNAGANMKEVTNVEFVTKLFDELMFDVIARINNLEENLNDLENKLKTGTRYHFTPDTWETTRENLTADSTPSDETAFASVNYLREMLKWIKAGAQPNNQLGLAYDANNAATNGNPQNLGAKWITTPTIPISTPNFAAPPNMALTWIEN